MTPVPDTRWLRALARIKAGGLVTLAPQSAIEFADRVDVYVAAQVAQRDRPMSSEEDAKLRELAEAATPGPWTLGRARDGRSYDGEWWPQVWPQVGAPIADLNGRIGAKHKDAADAAYIVAVSPDVVLGLLDRVAQRDRLRDAPSVDAAHLERQREWSERTFGPGMRTKGILDHIIREFREIVAEPTSLEWIDVVILALDGAWRAGHEPQAIIDAIIAKQTKNEGRTWPDWRTAPEDQAIEHDRGAALTDPESQP